ncbi:uncharacterized protein ACWYII_012731 [Salvelinus alpinus]
MTVSHQSLHSGRPLHRPLNPSQVPVITPPGDTTEEVDTAPAASQDTEDDLSAYSHSKQLTNPTLPHDSSNFQEYIGPDGVSGYQHVVLLAKSLLRLLEGPWISNRQIEEIMALWGNLPERDKAAVSYPERFRDRVLQGRFNNSKSSTVKGEESMKRYLLGQGSGPAQWPNTSRIVEAIFVRLCHKHPAGKMVLGNRVNRWAAILGDYRRIRIMVLGSPNLNTDTRLQLFEVNKLTLTQWYVFYILVCCMCSSLVDSVGESDPAPDLGQHDCREGGVRPLPHCSQEHITAASPINQQHLPAARGQNGAGYTAWQSSH